MKISRILKKYWIALLLYLSILVHCQFFRSNRTLDIFFFLWKLLFFFIPITSQKFSFFSMHFNTNHKNTWTFNLPLSIFQNYLLSKKWFSYIYFFFLSYFLHSHFFWLRKMNFSFLSSYCYTLAIWYFIIFLLLFSTYWVSGLFYSWILLILRNLDSFYKFWNQKNTFFLLHKCGL